MCLCFVHTYLHLFLTRWFRTSKNGRYQDAEAEASLWQEDEAKPSYSLLGAVPVQEQAEVQRKAPPLEED